MKTENCKKCGGICKPSKGILNTHNIQTNDLNKEFETKLVDCLKCESCGHSFVPKEISKQEKLNWFNNLQADNKASLAKDALIIKFKNEAEILICDMKTTINEDKPNQKQFKTFDESLFKAYINKFSNEDKLLMLSTLACEISTENPILNNLLNQISSYKGTK